jgi:hypothetical protein
MSTILLKGGSNGRLRVALPYSVERVARMKTIPGRRWHPEEKCWSVPHTDGMVERLLTLFTGDKRRARVLYGNHITSRRTQRNR